MPASRSLVAVSKDDLDSLIDAIAAQVKNNYLKSAVAASTYATQAALTNVTNGTTNIAYSAGANTSISASTIKAAIDELGVRTNNTNLTSFVESVVSAYVFSVDSSGNLILTTP